MEKELEKAIQLLENNDYIVVENTLNEGIDFDFDTKMVSYNPSHQDNVDTSIENNPSIDLSLIEGVPVWSIFKRKKGLGGDGNPLIYALKNENDWIFKSEQDKSDIIKQFKLITDKFLKNHSFDLTLIIPSTNNLNSYIANEISEKAKVELITGFVRKLTTEEVDELVQDFDSKFRAYYGTKYTQAYYVLREYLDKMDELKNGVFCRHLIKDNQMRNVIDFTLKLSEDNCARFASKINDRNVLIIDDVISRGESIKEMANIINKSYNPKSVSVMTLLSRLK